MYLKRRRLYAVTAKSRKLPLGRSRYKTSEFYVFSAEEAAEKFYAVNGTSHWLVCGAFPAPDVGVVDINDVSAVGSVAYA